MFDFSWLPQPIADVLPKLLNAIKSKLGLTLATVLLPALALVLGLIGYTIVGMEGRYGGSLLHGAVGVVIDTLGVFKASFKEQKDHNPFTDLAVLCGTLSIYSWVVALLLTFLRESSEKGIARLFAPNSVIIIGDSPFADRADKVWRNAGHHPLRIVSAKIPQKPDWRSRRVRATLDGRLVRSFSVNRAKHVLIDLGDDMQSLTLAFHAISSVIALGAGLATDAEWAIVVRDPALADHFLTRVSQLEATAGAGVTLPSLHYLHPERLAARHFLAEHPMFLSAETLGQSGVHALVVGNGPIARQLIELVFLTSLTPDQTPPAVTVIAPQADAEERAFLSGRPALGAAVDLTFVDAAALDGLKSPEEDGNPAAKQLAARQNEKPFTVILLVATSSTENIRAALRLTRAQARRGGRACKVFSYEDNGDEVDFLGSAGGVQKASAAIGGFEVFDLPDDVLATEICDAGRRDCLARALHEHYRDKYPGSQPPWSGLAETYRRANRCAADHWRAKMHILGFAVDDAWAETLPKLTRQDRDRLLKELEDARKNHRASPMGAALRCEHERWMCERLINGWSHGPAGQRDRFFHHLLVSWDELERDFPGEIAKDADQIVALVEYLYQHGDAKIVLQRKSAATG